MPEWTIYDRIEVEWEDSVMDQSGWADIEDFDFDSHKEAMNYKTTGYFLKKFDNAFFICQSYRPDGQICGIIALPYSAVKRVTKL